MKKQDIQTHSKRYGKVRPAVNVKVYKTFRQSELEDHYNTTAAERKAARLAGKTAARIAAERNQKPVAMMTMTIEWKESRMWGANPNLEAVVTFKDGTAERSPVFRCSGCGYDKTSTVVAEAFNHYLLYKLWAMTAEQVKGGHGSGDKGKAPYGICAYSPEHRHFGGGIGMSCYPAIAQFIGGTFETLASGKTFDVFRYTDGAQS